MTNISFGSTYIVTNRQNSYDSFSKFQNFALTKECENFEGGVHARFDDLINPHHTPKYSAQYTLIVPDKMDDEVERYCSYNGIEFNRLSHDYLLDSTKISNRILPPKKGQIRAKVDVKKLEKLIQTQSSNFEHCQKDYNRHYGESVDYMLKNGKEFPTTTLYIAPTGESSEDLINYIDRYGAKNLNPEQIRFDFCQRTGEPDHCVYFALRDLGMKNVPVYVNSETYEIGSALGIFK